MVDLGSSLTTGGGVSTPLENPVDLALQVVGAKWTVPIISELIGGAKRPCELCTSLKGINPKTLTARLRELERWGIVDRNVYREIPPRVEYSLTESGKEVLHVIAALKGLGEQWQSRPPK